MRPIAILSDGLGLVFGLVVAGCAALIYGRSKPAAGFVALAGLAFFGAEIVDFALDRVTQAGAHASAMLWQSIFAVVGIGRDVLFFGGLALALRALAQSKEARR